MKSFFCNFSLTHYVRVAFVLCILMSANAQAQDKIFKKNGDVIEAKVKSVEDDDIVFFYTDNPDGPTYRLSKSVIEKIKYKNGSEDFFDPAKQAKDKFTPRSAKNDSPAYEPKTILIKNEEYNGSNKIFDTTGHVNSHILSFSPFQFTENGFGFSASYESKLDKEGIFSFSVPLIVTINLTNPYAVKVNSDPMVYLMPGIKVYTRKKFGKFVYAIGPNFVFAAGQSTSGYTDNLQNTHITTYSHYILGVAASNSLNIFATKKVYLGFDMAIGYCIINNIGGTNEVFTGLINGCFKMGILY